MADEIDTGNTLKVDLAMSAGELEDASAFDAENGATISYVGGELLSFEDVTLTSAHNYDVVNLHRGQEGTLIKHHGTGTDFARLDDAIFKYDLPRAYIGKTIYLKFQSYNIFENAAQDLADVIAYPFVPQGLGFGTAPEGAPAMPTGLQRTNGAGFVRLNWNSNVANDNVQGYRVYRTAGPGGVIGTATLIATTTGQAQEYTDTQVIAANYTYFLTAVNLIGEGEPTAGVDASPTALPVVVGVDDLTDVDNTNPPEDGQILIWDQALGKWIYGDKAASTAIGIDPPVDAEENSLWWNSETGRLKILYNDGTSVQWVDAFAPIANTTTEPPAATDPSFDNVVFLAGAEPGLVDESSSAKTITVVAADPRVAGGSFGSFCIAANSTQNQFASVADSPDFDFGSGPFTLEAWVQWTSVPGATGFHYFLAQYDTGANQRSWAFLLQAGSLQMLLSTAGTAGTAVASAAWAPTNNVWYHVAADFDGTAYRTYVNGVMNGKSTTLVSPLHNSTAQMTLGRALASGATNTSFSGFLDEVRITKGIARYASDAGFTVPTTAFPRS